MIPQPHSSIGMANVVHLTKCIFPMRLVPTHKNLLGRRYLVRMSTSRFKDTETLVGSSNFVAWKIRLEVILDNDDVLEYMEGKVPNSSENDLVAAKVKYKKGELKAKNFLLIL